MQIDYQWTEEVRNCKMQFPTYGTLHIYNNNCILWSTGFNLTLFLGLPPNRSKVGEQNALDELILGNYSLKYCMQWSGEVNQMNSSIIAWFIDNPCCLCCVTIFFSSFVCLSHSISAFSQHLMIDDGVIMHYFILSTYKK